MTLVTVLVTVIAAFGTTEPLASLTSPVIVAVSCCANTRGEQSVNNPMIRVIIDSLVFIRLILQSGKGRSCIADKLFFRPGFANRRREQWRAGFHQLAPDRARLATVCGTNLAVANILY